MTIVSIARVNSRSYPLTYSLTHLLLAGQDTELLTTHNGLLSTSFDVPVDTEL